MRIQHNIAAMNSYRNFSGNTSKLNKNLEKLSTGYKINRAGDDAAGLAISEKMRVQISGLEAATKNAKDGISLVQTAEGALTEVHDMLNRMVTLTEQSANGTYDDSLDRNQLQKEVTALQTEIDRIADSTNYNGIKLLDGSLSGAGNNGARKTNEALKVEGFSDFVKDGTQAAKVTTVTATGTSTANAGEKINITIDMTDGSSHSFDLTLTGTTDVLYNGEKLTTQSHAFFQLAAANAVSAADVGAMAHALLAKDDAFTEQYNLGTAGATLTLTANEKNFTDPGIKSLTLSKPDGTRVTNQGSTTTEGKGEYKEIDTSAMKVYDAASSTMKEREAVVTVNNEKFAFVKDQASAKKLGEDVNVVFTANTAPNTADAQAMVKLMNQKLGANIGIPTGTTIDGITNRGYDGASGSGLTLQIGDTSDKFNQLTVSIEDMHSASIGVGTVDISTQAGASEAIDKIKSAVNFVSNTRGTLGALQNRLDHTINNLGVMRENIQSAESLIRDTDVAEEMMTYTKNNILNQSAQAMLAQANQLPQGVLQLLG